MHFNCIYLTFLGVDFWCWIGVLCCFLGLIAVMVASYARFYIFYQIRLSVHLLGNSCSLGLRYANFELVPDCHLVFSHFGF